jgi:hypothetical protein
VLAALANEDGRSLCYSLIAAIFRLRSAVRRLLAPY